MSDKTIGFIGLGLIGGSIAKALRRVHPEYRLIAYNRSRSSLVEAMSDGTINQATDVIDASFAECDFIFLCMPLVRGDCAAARFFYKKIYKNFSCHCIFYVLI